MSMTFEDVMFVIEEGVNDVLFTLQGTPCGITSEVKNSIFTFTIWNGPFYEQFSNARVMTEAPFFDGKSFREIFDTLDIRFA